MSLLLIIKRPFLIIVFISVFVIINLITINKSYADTIIINQSLDFGKFVLTDNTAPRSIDLLFSGGFVADPQYVFFTDPQQGQITVTDFPALTTLNVSLGLTNLNQSGIPSHFSISNSYTNPLTVITDATGAASFEVGAVLTSDGAGGTHTNGTYDGTFTVTVTP